MSRVNYNEDDQWGWIRWAGAAKQAIGGKRGQAALKELEAALLKLPTKRLITNNWALGGDVCALGAVDIHRVVQRTGMSWDGARLMVQQEWQASSEEDHSWSDEFDPAEFAKHRLGLTYTLVWEIIEKNDERFRHESPEHRYNSMLKWVRQQIV